MLVNWVQKPTGTGWDVEPDAVVWVDVAALERAFAAGDQHVEPGGGSRATSYENIGRRILSGREVWMPLVSVKESGRLRFSDGRHRFAWVRDHGALAIPVTIDPAAAARAAALFGTPLRTCEVMPAT